MNAELHLQFVIYLFIFKGLKAAVDWLRNCLLRTADDRDEVGKWKFYRSNVFETSEAVEFF